MKAKIYTEPFTKQGLIDIVEILSVVEVPKKLKRGSGNFEIAAYNLFNDHGLKRASVKYSDGTIDDNVFFNPNDIII